MGKNVYAIRINRFSNKFVINVIPIVSETKGMYYLSNNVERYAVRHVTQLRKSEENGSLYPWTTDKDKFNELAQNYINREYQNAEEAMSRAGGAIATIGVSASELGFTVTSKNGFTIRYGTIDVKGTKYEKGVIDEDVDKE